MKPLSLKIDEHLHALICARSKAEGRSVSDVTRAAIEAGLTADAVPAITGVGELSQVLKILERLQALCMLTAAANSKVKDKGLKFAMREIARDLSPKTLEIARLIDDAEAESEESWS